MPWPPSANRYWRRVGNMTLVSKEAREYKKLVKDLVLSWNIKQFTGRVELIVLAYPPDNRMRDLDNLLKVTIDSLEEAGVFIDDSQIEAIYIKKMSVVKDGKLYVSILDLEGVYIDQ
jgi:crossover junction endodeoxyribonuclease RusA